MQDFDIYRHLNVVILLSFYTYEQNHISGIHHVKFPTLSLQFVVIADIAAPSAVVTIVAAAAAVSLTTLHNAQ
jgi:hypothetical protein